MAPATTVTTDLEFVVGNTPDQLKGCARRKVKSHVSKLGWKVHQQRELQQQQQQQQQQQHPHQSSGGVQKRSNKRRKRVTQVTRTYELVEVDEAAQAEAYYAQIQVQQALVRAPLSQVLGAGRIDPFASYPGPKQAFIPSLVDHYLVHMAVDIPELDQPGNRGLLRSRWFPLVNSDVSTFRVIILLAAANMISMRRVPGAGFRVLQLKHDAIQCINQGFGDAHNRTSDAMIGAVAKMASFEAMHGNVESYRLHMEGLRRMVEMRGGLHALGLGGLLRRIIVWIDLNSGFLMGVPRYFPGHMFEGEVSISEPNPERFIAVSDNCEHPEECTIRWAEDDQVIDVTHLEDTDPVWRPGSEEESVTSSSNSSR